VDIPIEIGKGGVDEVTLLVSRTTRFTTPPTTYSLEIS
jgi:hypothetical protein